MNRKNALYQMRQILLLNICLMGGFALVGCDIPIDDTINRPMRLTEIVRVEVLPNPVAVGDSLTLRCVTKDSLATGMGYEYVWFTGGAEFTTTTPVTKIKVNFEPNIYSFSVRVQKNVPNTIFPSRVFQVTVIP